MVVSDYMSTGLGGSTAMNVIDGLKPNITQLGTPNISQSQNISSPVQLKVHHDLLAEMKMNRTVVR